MTNQYMTKLYHDLLSNSPQTVTIDIPADMGTGQISQVVTKQGAVVSDWKMNYFSDMNVQGVSCEDYIQLLFCFNAASSDAFRQGLRIENQHAYFKIQKHPWTAAMKICYTNRGLLMLTREEIQMSEQQFTDFFDPEIQKIVSEDGCSIYRMKNVTGEGVITRYEILPGIELFYNDFHMSDGQNQNKLPHSDVLEINHCREGRFECEFANGDYQYVGAGDLAINRLTNETTSTYFPLSHYHGISITIDLPTADQTMKRIESVIGGLNIDVFSIADKFCKNDTCVVLRTQSEIEHIFRNFIGWSLG